MAGSIRVAGAFILSVIVGTVLVSITSTHINLVELIRVGTVISLGGYVRTIALDLVGFGPTLAIVLTIGFLIAFLVAAWITNNMIRARTASYVLAGFAAVVVMMLAVKGFYFLEDQGGYTPIASARTTAGLLMMGLGGAVAGFFFAHFSRAR